MKRKRELTLEEFNGLKKPCQDPFFKDTGTYRLNQGQPLIGEYYKTVNALIIAEKPKV